jgi:hypothetical protein
MPLTRGLRIVNFLIEGEIFFSCNRGGVTLSYPPAKTMVTSSKNSRRNKPEVATRAQHAELIAEAAQQQKLLAKAELKAARKTFKLTRKIAKKASKKARRAKLKRDNGG